MLFGDKWYYIYLLQHKIYVSNTRFYQLETSKRLFENQTHCPVQIPNNYRQCPSTVATRKRITSDPNTLSKLYRNKLFIEAFNHIVHTYSVCRNDCCLAHHITLWTHWPVPTKNTLCWVTWAIHDYSLCLFSRNTLCHYPKVALSSVPFCCVLLCSCVTSHHAVTISFSPDNMSSFPHVS